MSLRRRLFFFVFVPVAVLYLAFGFYGVLQVRTQLIDDIDDELKSELALSASVFSSLGSSDLVDLVMTQTGVGSSQLGALVDTRTNEVGILPSSRDGVLQPPPSGEDLAPQMLVGRLDTPFSLQSEDGKLEYRARATRLDGGRIILLGESLDRVDALTRDFVIGTLINGAILLSAMAGVVWFAVRHGLRPLRSFVETTSRVAHGDLSERVEARQQDPAFAQIAQATNSMLDQIEVSYEQQRISRERLNDLVADAAHELRTPLTAIRGTVDMQKMGVIDTDDKTRTAFRGLDEHTQRMQQIVEHLLVIARAESMRVEAQSGVTSIIDLARLVQNEIDVVHQKSATRQIELHHDHVGYEVSADEPLLVTAIAHLLQNACRHTPNDASIRVRLDQTDTEVRLEVSDTGPGISQELGDRIFDRFVRGDTSRSRETGGAGLGLSIVKSVIESANGSIDFESTTGKGATFVVRLPRYVRSGTVAAT